MSFLRFALLAVLAASTGLASAQNKSKDSGPALTGNMSTSLGSGSESLVIDDIVAIVNSDIITRNELNRQLATIERQMVRKGLALPDRLELKNQILDRMIIDRVQMQRAAEVGIRLSDTQVDEAMGRVAEQNGMRLEPFLERLREDGISPERFREEIRNELSIARLREQEVEGRIQVSDSEIQAWMANRSKGAITVKPQVNWIQLLVKTAGTTESSAKARATQLEGALKKGITLEEILKTNPDLAIEGTGQMGWQSFDDVPSLFTDFLTRGDIDSVNTVQSPNGFHVLKIIGRKQEGLTGLDSKPVTQTLARHILIRPGPEVSETEARRQLQFVLDRLRSGDGDFETLARQYSVDGSAAKGGDLGWLFPGDTVPEFEEVMNRLGTGEVSGIVESRFGLHIIQVVNRRQQSLSEDRQKMIARQAIRAEKSKEATDEWLRQLKDRAFIEIRS